MDYSIRKAADTTEILLSGRMTFADHERFRSIIAAFDGPPGHHMVFDLAEVDFVDSSGMGMFIIARDTARKRQLKFSLRGARNEVLRLINVAKFQTLFDISD